MVAIYQEYLFEGRRFDIDGLTDLFGRMLWNAPAWPYFAPLGIAAGGFYWLTWQVCTGSPLKQSGRVKTGVGLAGNLLQGWSRHRMNLAPADTEGGSRLGMDQKNRRPIALSDVDANKHTLSAWARSAAARRSRS